MILSLPCMPKLRLTGSAITKCFSLRCLDFDARRPSPLSIYLSLALIFAAKETSPSPKTASFLGIMRKLLFLPTVYTDSAQIASKHGPTGRPTRTTTIRGLRRPGFRLPVVYHRPLPATMKHPQSQSQRNPNFPSPRDSSLHSKRYCSIAGSMCYSYSSRWE
jgi:hypothetical protein